MPSKEALLPVLLAMAAPQARPGVPGVASTR